MKMIKKVLYLILLIILSLLPANISLAAVKSTKNPNSAKACAICHFRWVDTFFVEGKGSDLVEYRKRLWQSRRCVFPVMTAA
jgi:hypothetical protein